MAETTKPTVADLAWMAGSWSGPMGQQTLEETWSQPQGGSISAMIRFLGENTTSMFELIVIEEEQGSLVFRVKQWLPGYLPRDNNPAQKLTLAKLTDRHVRFEADGPGDFKSLSYSRAEDAVLTIDAVTSDGNQFQLNLHRQTVGDND